MALFGDLGKALGLGTARQTMDAALQGALRGAVLGQPFMGGAAGALSAGRTQQGQSTAVATSGTPPRETAFSGETIPGNAQIYGADFRPRRIACIYDRAAASPSGRQAASARRPSRHCWWWRSG